MYFESIRIFFILSGLGVNKYKTRLSLFGCNLDKSELARSLELKWFQKFTLLGIDFDQNLEEMECNFEKAVGEMQKVANFGHLLKLYVLKDTFRPSPSGSHSRKSGCLILAMHIYILEILIPVRWMSSVKSVQTNSGRVYIKALHR